MEIKKWQISHWRSALKRSEIFRSLKIKNSFCYLCPSVLDQEKWEFLLKMYSKFYT